MQLAASAYQERLLPKAWHRGVLQKAQSGPSYRSACCSASDLTAYLSLRPSLWRKAWVWLSSQKRVVWAHLNFFHVFKNKLNVSLQGDGKSQMILQGSNLEPFASTSCQCPSAHLLYPQVLHACRWQSVRVPDCPPPARWPSSVHP